ISEAVTKPSEKDEFFGNDVDAIRRLENERENIRNALNSCDTNLFMGIFFDGTGNNFEDSLNRKDYSHSNVARLYSAHPGLSVPEVLPPETDWPNDKGDYDNFFRIYLPGVGTRFDQVGDSGEGFWDGKLGGGTGRLGQI